MFSVSPLSRMPTILAGISGELQSASAETAERVIAEALAIHWSNRKTRHYSAQMPPWQERRPQACSTGLHTSRALGELAAQRPSQMILVLSRRLSRIRASA